MIFQCKMCGGTLEIMNNETVAVCESCGTKQTLPKLDNEKRIQLYDRANHFRRNNEFDKAMGIYEMLLSEDKEDAEAYWSLVLCRYGIEYVEDPGSHKRIPTVNRAQYTSVFDDNDYKYAIKYADGYQRDIYEKEANKIDEIQKGILEISTKEEPFDIFICYKETDSRGGRTQDSVYAQDIYNALTQEGYRVFFSRITLEDKLGSAYEPYIFAALNTAKVMLAVGTVKDNFNAVWVKNEWSRYLSLIKSGNNKTLIPLYRDISPYDMPKEFTYLQSLDMAKIGFMQDLIRGIHKLIDTDKPDDEKKGASNTVGTAADALLKRAFLFLNDKDWEKACEYFEKVLDVDPENPRAYLGKFMYQNHIANVSEIAKTPKRFDTNDSNYKKAILFSSDKGKAEISGYISGAEEEYEKLHLQIERYHSGEVIPENYAEAFELYKTAAENGNPLAYIMLGKYYEHGYGIEKPELPSNKMAYKSYSCAAEYESNYKAEALYEVGRCLLFGKGVSCSQKTANEYI